MSDPELSLMHTVASSSSTDLDCIIGGVQFNAETGKEHIWYKKAFYILFLKNSLF